MIRKGGRYVRGEDGKSERVEWTRSAEELARAAVKADEYEALSAGEKPLEEADPPASKPRKRPVKEA